MRVFVSGGTGFVGAAIVQALLDAGEQVVIGARKAASRPHRAGVEYRELDFNHLPADGAQLFAGVDAFVNAVGIIRETRELKFRVLHEEAPTQLFRAAQSAGVRRFVQISAAGVSPESPFAYFRTKAATEAFLREQLPGCWILRPSLVFGADGEATALFRTLSALPLVPLPAGGEFRFRPIVVEDLAALVVEVLHKDGQGEPAGPIEVGGADELSLKEILLALRKPQQAEPRGATLSIPKFLMKPAAWFGDLTGAGPLTNDMLEMLVQSEAPDISRMRQVFSFQPRGLRGYLAEQTKGS